MAATVSGPAFVGLDVGGTAVKGALVDGAGTIVSRLHEPVARQDTELLLGQLARAARELASGRDDVAAIGVGLPGIVDRRTGRLRVAPNLHVLDGVAVPDEVARRAGLPAFTENDANAHALAEAWLGAGRGADSLMLVALGTGVGGGLVLGGRVWPGTSGFAGELGHLQVVPDGRRCGCGSWGCLETEAGAPAWGLTARELMDGRASRLAGGDLSPAAVTAAALAGDGVALDVVGRVARAIGVGVAASLNLLNVERVIVGGGVAAAGPFLLERIVEETRVRTFPQVFADCSFHLAEMGNDAGVVGAAAVAWLGTGGRLA